MSYVTTSASLPQWVGRPPKGWHTDWLKWHVDLSTRRPNELESETLPYISNEDIESWTGRLLKTDPQPTDADGRLFSADDVLFNKLRPYLAKVHHAQFDGISSGELLCLKSSERVAPRFLFYVVSSRALIDAVDAETFGSKMPRADWEIVGHQPLPLPPLETQKRIAAFLDEKTTRIDALMTKKQALLERLAEKRQAIITQAVTKGLNPTAPMKDSGIDWIGQIPAHWGVRRLKFLTEGPLKYGANASAEWDETDWPRFIRITDVDPSGKLRPETFRSLPPEVAQPFLLTEGDILLARSGATVGKSFIYRSEWGRACFAGYLIRARIAKEYSSGFVHLFLNSSVFWSWVSANFIQSTIQNISAEKYAGLWVTCPPHKDQIGISSFVATATSQVAEHEEKIELSVAKLHEYRSALIAAGVTGRIEGLQ